MSDMIRYTIECMRQDAVKAIDENRDLTDAIGQAWNRSRLLALEQVLEVLALESVSR